KFSFDTESYQPVKPEFFGVRQFENFDLTKLAEVIDWTPFFQTWELKGKYPDILEDHIVGKEATKLYHDALDILKKMISKSWTKASGAIGFWPANSVGETVELYKDESRSKIIESFHFLRQQRKMGKKI